MKLLLQIAEGWRNNLFPPEELKERIQMVSEVRMAICRGCEWNSDNKPKQTGVFARFDTHCTHCGCTLSAKTKCFSCECPLKKWEAISTEAEWKQIKQSIGEDDSN